MFARRIKPVGVIWALLLVGFVSGCAQAPPAAPAVPKVVVTAALRVPIVEWDEYIGRIDPIEDVEVRARVSGHLQSTHFEEGQIVRKGDLLCVLDQRPFQIAVQQARADVAATNAKVEEAQARAKQYKAEIRLVESQYRLATQMLGRAKRLIGSRAISQEDLDTRESAFTQSEADLDVKRANVTSAEAAIVTAQADRNSAEARLASAQLNLVYTEVRAPIGGRISRRAVTEGNFITGGSEQSTLLTTIVSLDPIYCHFDIDEQSFLKYMRLVKGGQLGNLREAKLPVYIGLSDAPTANAYHGYMDFLDNRLNLGTATLRGRAILPNPDLSLTPGLFARARIPGSGNYDAVLVPDLAIGTDQSEKFVYLVDAENKVQRQKIDTGPRARGLRIVRQGLKGNERLVLRGLQRVRPGIQVDVSEENTVAVDDGLPTDGRPHLDEKWLSFYDSVKKAKRVFTPDRGSAIGAGPHGGTNEMIAPEASLTADEVQP